MVEKPGEEKEIVVKCAHIAFPPLSISGAPLNFSLLSCLIWTEESTFKKNKNRREQQEHNAGKANVLLYFVWKPMLLSSLGASPGHSDHS